jgi:hypothetical protein
MRNLAKMHHVQMLRMAVRIIQTGIECGILRLRPLERGPLLYFLKDIATISGPLQRQSDFSLLKKECQEAMSSIQRFLQSGKSGDKQNWQPPQKEQIVKITSVAIPKMPVPSAKKRSKVVRAVKKSRLFSTENYASHFIDSQIPGPGILYNPLTSHSREYDDHSWKTLVDADLESTNSPVDQIEPLLELMESENVYLRTDAVRTAQNLCLDAGLSKYNAQCLKWGILTDIRGLSETFVDKMIDALHKRLDDEGSFSFVWDSL